MSRHILAGAAFALAATTTVAIADAGHGSAIGQPGSDAAVDRVIEVEMSEMKYMPDTISVEPGETIKFVVTNVGDLVHEFNIGKPETWDGHANEMMTMMQQGMMTADHLDHDKMMEGGMMHDDANSILLEPGDSGAAIWTFPQAGEIGFACNVPGHREAGMVGDFRMPQGG
jgi:uncharacterized cupredoxin-like copper-binding protein